MQARTLLGVVLGALAIAAAGCAGQMGAKGNVAALGCEVDAKRLCEQEVGQTMNTGTLLTNNQEYLQQNSLATSEFHADFSAPGGSKLEIECRENMQQRKIVYASASPNGTVSDSDKQWLRQAGYCVDSSAEAAAP